MKKKKNMLKKKILNLSKVSGLFRKKKDFTIVSKLYKKLNYIKFFEKLLKNDFKTQVFELISKLKIRIYNKNEIIFLQYTRPIKFYTIIQGKVLVFIKNKKNYKISKFKLKKKKQEEKKIETELNLDIDNKIFDKNDFLNKFKKDPFFFDQKTGKFLHQLVAILKKGDSFGELGIMNKCNRLASVITVEKTEIGELSSKNFQEIIKKSIFTEIDSKLRYLKGWLNNFCTSDEIFVIGAYFKKLKVKKNDYIFREKNKFDKIFLMENGEVCLEKKNGKEKEKDDVILFNTKIDYLKKISKSVF